MAGDEIIELGGNSAEQLAGFIERIESLEGEKGEVTAKIKAEKELAKAAGFDLPSINQILKERKGDTEKTTSARAVTEAYRKALADRPGELGEWAQAFNAAQNTAKSRRPPAKLKPDKGGSGEKLN